MAAVSSQLAEIWNGYRACDLGSLRSTRWAYTAAQTFSLRKLTSHFHLLWHGVSKISTPSSRLVCKMVQETPWLLHPRLLQGVQNFCVPVPHEARPQNKNRCVHEALSRHLRYLNRSLHACGVLRTNWWLSSRS